MTTVPKKSQVFYEFDRYRFYPDQRRLLQDGRKQLWLDPKPNGLLHVLVRNSRKLVTHEELKRQVWPETQHVADRTLHQHKYALSAILGKNSGDENYIENITGKGYRFTVEVLERWEADLEDSEHQETETVNADVNEKPTQEFDPPQHLPSSNALAADGDTHRSRSLVGDHRSHVMVSCSLYSLLYSVALFIEIAYQYNRFSRSAWAISLIIFLWIFGTSFIGLSADWQRTTRGKDTGVLLSLIVFVACGFLAYVALGLYLPNEPITEARFQTYPAHGAYLKSVYYFLPLAVVFLILPFHSVISIEREIRAGRDLYVRDLLFGKRGAVLPAGSVFLRPWMLGPLLFCAAMYALLATAHLFDNLEPGTYTSLFMQLVQLRLLLYFALGLECLLWYSWSLNEIKLKVLERK